jgi:hypothetical protein
MQSKLAHCLATCWSAMVPRRALSVSDLAEVHELITQTCRDAIYSVGEAIKRQDEEIGKIKQ